MPSLLKEIRDAAVDANVPIANVLRKCAVLGAKLKNNELRDWALQELNGYKDENDFARVPEGDGTPHGRFRWTSSIGLQECTYSGDAPSREDAGPCTDRPLSGRRG